MVRVREFEDRDVLTAARDRLDRTILGADRLAVAFSGGKDSTTVLHLVKEAQERAGDDRPVLAFYRDIEFASPAVTAKVAETAALPWVDLRWLAVRLQARTVVAGIPLEVETWHPDREWVRPLPDGATLLNDRPWTADDVDGYVQTLSPGRVVIVTGVRAAESLIRYRSVVNKLHEPWLVKSQHAGVTLARPLYDWTEADVLRYLADHGIRPADVYDAQAWHSRKGDLRTASLLAAEQMRDLPTLAVTDPDAYDLLVRAFPQVAVAKRYLRDLKDKHLKGADVETWEELEEWVYQRFAGRPHALAGALDRLEFARGLAKRNPHGFPPWWVQHEIAREGHGTGMMPLPKTHPRYGQKTQADHVDSGNRTV